MEPLVAGRKTTDCSQNGFQPATSVNVGEMERIASGILGSVFVMGGLLKGSFFGVATAALGAGLLYRGATGHCYTYQALGVSTADPQDELTEQQIATTEHSNH